MLEYLFLIPRFGVIFEMILSYNFFIKKNNPINEIYLFLVHSFSQLFRAVCFFFMFLFLI